MDPSNNVSGLGKGVSVSSKPASDFETKFALQKEFFDELKGCREDTPENRDALKKMLDKIEVSDTATVVTSQDGSTRRLMNSSVRSQLLATLNSKVSTSFWSIFSTPKSLSETVFKKMSRLAQMEYLKLDGFEGGLREESWFELDKIAKFITDGGSRFNLGQSRLRAVPKSLLNNNLKDLDCSFCNNLTQIVPEKGQCLNLEKVDFTGSGIQKFDFTGASKLKKIKVGMTGLRGADKTNRKKIVDGLPIGVPVIVEGLDLPVKGPKANWPENVSVEDLGNGKVRLTRSEIAGIQSPPEEASSSGKDSQFEIER